MTYGFVYCLDNVGAMPGLYKIGHTHKSPQQRAAELSTTGVPEPFSVVGYIEIDRPQVWEQRFHRFLSDYRHNSQREFFKAPIEVIAPLFFFNEYACAFADCDFYPAVHQAVGVAVHELPNPYDQHPWLAVEP